MEEWVTYRYPIYIFHCEVFYSLIDDQLGVSKKEVSQMSFVRHISSSLEM